MNTETQATYDAEGYLIDPEQWDESVARLLAADEAIELEPAYWPILCFMRQYWSSQRVHAQARLNAVARQLNERPRKTLGFETPAECFNACVASTG